MRMFDEWVRGPPFSGAWVEGLPPPHNPLPESTLKTLTQIQEMRSTLSKVKKKALLIGGVLFQLIML